VAILYRNKSIIKITTNSKKTHPKFGRRYRNGISNYHLHAEQSACRFAKPGDTLIVMRFLANGNPSMAKPCIHCQKAIEKAGIRKVTYTNWDGNYIVEKL